jgi:predicted DsbA family dithiol-disulfide isomerase
MRSDMILFSHRRTTLVFILAGFVSCNKASTPPAASGASGLESPSTPVAKFNGKTLTMKEVDSEMKGELMKLDKQKLEMRQRQAEQMALKELIKAEATKIGKSEEEYVKSIVEPQIPKPSDEEISKVFEENKARMPPGSTLETMKDQIAMFITQQPRQEAIAKIAKELLSKAKFENLLEEPRITVAAVGPSRGPENAKVTIVEFSDFECPYCSRAEEAVSKVAERYAGKVRIVFRHYPLPMHSHAVKAAEASMCANDQGKFWEMHKQLFANQKALELADLKGYAKTVGLDETKFASCLESAKMKSLVESDQKAGEEVGVNGTPAFFINGKSLSGALPFEEFEKVIDAELAKGG